MECGSLFNINPGYLANETIKETVYLLNIVELFKPLAERLLSFFLISFAFCSSFIAS